VDNVLCGGKDKMTDQDQMKTAERVVVKKIKKMHPIQRLFLLDVLIDKESRPAFLWAFGALVLGTLVYHRFEGWSYLDSLYFCVISLATVGYGDLTPTTPGTKIFTMIYIINGIAILLTVFDRIRVVRTRGLDSNESEN
jgi:voltage-gated potassium channel